MKKTLILLATALFLEANAAFAHNEIHEESQRGGKYKYAFQNLELSDEVRVDSLIAILTLDEKIKLLAPNLGVERLGIPNCGPTEGLHGLQGVGVDMIGRMRKAEEAREAKGEKDFERFDPSKLCTTVFPQSYGLGCTWDPDLIRRIGEQESVEARYYAQKADARRKSLIVFSPNADLGRDPRWGRTEECFGEDPYLTSRLVVAMVKGLQGDDPRYWRTASLMKHFLANSNEDGRDSTSSNFDQQLFDRYYAYPFMKGITEGGSQAFMASYNAWNGTPMCVHPCLEEITRKQWGHRGIICTDGSAYTLLMEAHKHYKTWEEGAAAVVKAGVGQFLDKFEPYISNALQQGLLTEKDIENAIRGNIYVALKLGLLDGPDTKNPYINIGKDSTQIAPWLTDEAKALAREATAKSIVLLKNRNPKQPMNPKNPILPLNKTALKKIAVIGPYADEIVQDWYSGYPSYTVTILQGIKNAVGDGIEVVYAKDNSMDEATKAAAEADVAIVCVGNHPWGTKPDWKFCPVPSDGREANDRHSLMLPDEDLVMQVHAANPNTVLVLVSSFPYAINKSDERIPAILHITHCSQEQGNGLADVLFGDVNPAGRTTQTWPRDILDLPPMMDYDIRHGRTYMYNQKPVLYPFGYGLSYTTFSYGELKTKDRGATIEATVEVTNTGDRDGDEVVQIYAEYPENSDAPKRQLCAFKRVNIAKGETKKVTLSVEKSFLYNTSAKLILGR